MSDLIITGAGMLATLGLGIGLAHNAFHRETAQLRGRLCDSYDDLANEEEISNAHEYDKAVLQQQNAVIAAQNRSLKQQRLMGLDWVKAA